MAPAALPEMVSAERTLTLERGPDGQLRASFDGATLRVRAVRCFPWSGPDGYVSLRDDDEEEVALVLDPGRLDPDSRAALEASLAEAGLVLDIEAVEAIDDDFELRCWRVRTRQGTRSFQTPLDVWPRPAPDGSQLLEDVQGDVFRLPRATTLDPRSRRLLWAFVD